MSEETTTVELVAGEVVHKAAPKPAHGDAQVTLAALLYPFKRRRGGPPDASGGWWIMSEVEVAYPSSEEIFRHDLVGLRRARFPQRPDGVPVTDRADWVCEILSPSTARYDVVQKQRTLHQHGVLSVLRHGPDAYLNVMNAGTGAPARPWPAAGSCAPSPPQTSAVPASTATADLIPLDMR